MKANLGVPTEKQISEANNDAALTTRPFKRWAMNRVHFQLGMLACSLKCWLFLFNRGNSVDATEMERIAQPRFLRADGDIPRLSLCHWANLKRRDLIWVCRKHGRELKLLLCPIWFS